MNIQPVDNNNKQNYVRPIIRKGHPGLEVIATPFTLISNNNNNNTTTDNNNNNNTDNNKIIIFENQELANQIANELRETLLSTGTAIGLAATQINRPYRVIAFRLPADRSEDKITCIPLTIAFNPTIDDFHQSSENNVVEGLEGCLSLPGLMGRVPRFNTITYSFIDGETGERVRRTVSGNHSRLIQHELDHLDGMTYVQRMTDMSMLGYVDEMKQYKV